MLMLYTKFISVAQYSVETWYYSCWGAYSMTLLYKQSDCAGSPGDKRPNVYLEVMGSKVRCGNIIVITSKH